MSYNFVLASSGPLVSPYDYNGFIAKLEFLEKIEENFLAPTIPAAPPLAALTHFTYGINKSKKYSCSFLLSVLMKILFL